MHITINKTKDYSLFKTIKENRTTNKNHIARIVKSIAKKSLMADMPILVDKDMNILDGQHRFEACKILGEEVFFKVSEKAILEDIPMLNNTTKRWTPEDYLNQYINQGNENYIKFKAFMEWGKIPSVSITQKFLSNYLFNGYSLSNKTSGGNFSNSFNLGKFIYPSDDTKNKRNVLRFNEVNKYCSPKKPYSRTVQVAYDLALKTKDFSHERLIEKLNLNPVPPFNNAITLLDHLEKIYNFNVKSNNGYLRFNRS